MNKDISLLDNEFVKEFSEEFEVPVGYDRNEFHYAQGLFAGEERGEKRVYQQKKRTLQEIY